MRKTNKTTQANAITEKRLVVEARFILPKKCTQLALDAFWHETCHADHFYGGLSRQDLEHRLEQEELTEDQVRSHISKINQRKNEDETMNEKEDSDSEGNEGLANANQREKLGDQDASEFVDDTKAIEELNAAMDDDLKPDIDDEDEDEVQLYPFRFSCVFTYSIIFYYHFHITGSYLPFGGSPPELCWMYLYLFTYDRNNALELQYSKERSKLNIYGPSSLYRSKEMPAGQDKILASQNTMSRCVHTILSSASDASLLYRCRDGMSSIELRRTRNLKRIEKLFYQQDQNIQDYRKTSVPNNVLNTLVSEIEKLKRITMTMGTSNIVQSGTKLFEVTGLTETITTHFMESYTLLARPQYIDIISTFNSQYESALEDIALGSTQKLLKLKHTIGVDYTESNSRGDNHYFTPIKRFLRRCEGTKILANLIPAQLATFMQELISDIDSNRFTPSVEETDLTLIATSSLMTGGDIQASLKFAQVRLEEYATMNFEPVELTSIAKMLVLVDKRSSETNRIPLTYCDASKLNVTSVNKDISIVFCNGCYPLEEQERTAIAAHITRSQAQAQQIKPIETTEAMLEFTAGEWRAATYRGNRTKVAHQYAPVELETTPVGTQLTESSSSLVDTRLKYIAQQAKALREDAKRSAAMFPIATAAGASRSKQEIHGFINQTCFLGRNTLGFKDSLTEWSFQAGYQQYLCSITTEADLIEMLNTLMTVEHLPVHELIEQPQPKCSADATIRDWNESAEIASLFPIDNVQSDLISLALIGGVSFRTQLFVALIDRSLFWQEDTGYWQSMRAFLSSTAGQDTMTRFQLTTYAEETCLTSFSKEDFIQEIDQALIELFTTANYTSPFLQEKSKLADEAKIIMTNILTSAREIFQDDLITKVKLNTDEERVSLCYAMFSKGRNHLIKIKIKFGQKAHEWKCL